MAEIDPTYILGAGKYILIGVGILMFCCVGCCGIFGLKAQAEQVEAKKGAEHFLALLAKQKSDEAYLRTSLEYRVGQNDRAALLSFNSMRLPDYASVTWTNTEFIGGKSSGWRLQGYLHTQNKDVHRLTMEMVKEQGEWRMNAVSTDQKRN
jgi:hypothetical protein